MEPLANQIRPVSLDEYVGQQHLVGAGKPLRLAIEQGHVFSFVLWGTPGTGKTTRARIYANAINAEFHELSAVSAGKDDIRKIVRSSDTPVRLSAKHEQDESLPFDIDETETVVAGGTGEADKATPLADAAARPG